MNEIALVSAITDKYDNIKPIDVPDNVDCFLFTDSKVTSDHWNVINIVNNGWHPRMQAKRYKILTHRYLNAYKRYFWIDGSIIMNKGAVAEMLAESSGHQLSMFRHPQRDCVYDEGRFSMTMLKYDANAIAKQMDNYLSSGYPEHNGLWSGGVFIRDNNTFLNNVFEFWMSHNTKWSYQDQISLPVVLNHFKLIPQAFSQPLWDNSWFSIAPHKDDL